MCRKMPMSVGLYHTKKRHELLREDPFLIVAQCLLCLNKKYKKDDDDELSPLFHNEVHYPKEEFSQ